MDRIVGREHELEAVTALLDLEEDGPLLLLLEGEAGIGKTTLWRAGVDEARRRGFRVLAYAGTSAETQLSFTALRDLLGDAFDDVAGELPPPQRRLLAVTLLREEPTERPPEPGAIAVAFSTALRVLGARGPTLLAIDDLQWLDNASATPIGYALRRAAGPNVGMLVSRRVEPEDERRLDLRPAERERVRTIRLGRLSVGALGRVFQERLGLTYARPTLQRLHAVSGGNPFFALELARALGSPPLPVRPGVALPVPDTLRGVIRERLRGLPAATLDVLAVAAALNRPTLHALGLAADADAAPLVEPALDAQVAVIEEDDVRFTHPLYAAAVYELAGPSRRREIHRRLAAVVADGEERVRHLALAADEPDETLAAELEGAARGASLRGAPATAAELVGHSRQLTPAADGDGSRRRAVAEADYRFAAGDTGGASALLEELVAAAAPGPDRAGLLRRQARLRHFEHDIGASVELLHEALAEAGGDALRGEIEEGLAWGMLLVRRELPAAAEHARSAASLAERRGDRAALAEALAAQALLDFVLGRPWRQTMERALGLEEFVRGLRVVRHPSFAYGYCLSCSDDLDRAREVFEELLRRSENAGDESSIPSILNHLTLIECLAGRWEAAARHADECHARAVESGQRPTQTSVLGKRALLAARRGVLDEARDHAAEALRRAGADDFERPEDTIARGGETAIWTLGFAALLEDDAAEAHRLLAPMTRALLDAGIEEPGEVRCLPDAVEALVALGRLEEAEAGARRLEEWAARLERPSARAAALRCRASLAAARGDGDAGVSALEEAAVQAARARLPFEHARTLLALGVQQRRARRRRAARETLEAAARAFAELGADPWAERARAELARIGGRRGAGGELTPTELRIAELVAEGRTNKEVAAVLVVSERTVESALTQIYRKLDVRSRTQLARKLGETA